ncbi:MAG: protein rep [Sideroxydans sp.]
MGIDQRQDLSGAVRTSLGIFANTVHAPKSVPKPKKAVDDDAVNIGRKARFQLQRAAQGLLRGQRVEHCQRSTMSSAGVSVYRSPTGATYGNLATCGSVWHCPICAARITEQRRQELQGAINAWAKQKGEVFLMSLTFPHLDHQLLADNLAKFSAALRKFKNSRAYKRTMSEAGAVGSIRALEVTHGKENGWHPHTHDLIFASKGQLDKLQTLQMVWIETLIKADLADRSQINDMMKAAFDVSNGDYAAEYVAKFGHEATEASKLITENTWGASHELTKAYAKVGKRLGGRTPFTLLADYVRGDNEAGKLFQEFGKQFKGKRQLFWSPKLRAALQIVEEEKTDEQIAAEEADDREFVTVLDHEQWRLVLSRNARFEVLRVAQDEGAEGVAALLDELAGRKHTHSDTYAERGRYAWHRLGGFLRFHA